MNAFFRHDGLDFHYLDEGTGIPFVFQHGLGGDVSQPSGLFRPPDGVRLIALDCRGHGETRPLGDPAKLCFDYFAADLAALLDHLGVERAVVGGISMGAGVALNFALRYPQRTAGLVLSRPAWLDEAMPAHLRVYPEIARAIRAHGVEKAREMLRHLPEVAVQLDSPRAEETAEKLERIPADAPHRDRCQWASLRIPVLVLGNRNDTIHPFAFAEELARAIPGAELREITPKSADAALHAAQVQSSIQRFLNQKIQPC